MAHQRKGGAVSLITLTEAASRLGLSVSTVRHQAQGGRLRASRIGRDWLVAEGEVERYRVESLGKPGRPRAHPTSPI